jgi:hypothetical protein
MVIAIRKQMKAPRSLPSASLSRPSVICFGWLCPDSGKADILGGCNDDGDQT